MAVSDNVKASQQIFTRAAMVRPTGKPRTGRPKGTGGLLVSRNGQKLPIVPYDIGVDLEQYGDVESVEKKLATLRRVKALLARNITFNDVSVLAAPGSLGVPTVGKINDRTGLGPAEAAASTSLIGQTAQTPDPRTIGALRASQDATSAASVSPAAMGLGASHQGAGAAVPTSQTPMQPYFTEQLKQLPDKIADEMALPTRSLFRR
jgi:hypothetical protein